MKVLISGTIVQLTFGLKVFDISHFQKVRIFPERFYFRRYKAYLKGGTSLAGVVLLSWKDFVEGFEDEEDRYNLGLHEIAHALKINVIHGDDFDLLFASYLTNWQKIGHKEFLNMKRTRQGFLRDYAGQNMEEFFAVCVEHFFEAAEEFSKQLPDIYNHMCVLLNQDPRNKTSNHTLSKNFANEVNKKTYLIPVPLKVPLTFKNMNLKPHHSLLFPAAIIFTITTTWLLWYTQMTRQEWWDQTIIIVIIGLIFHYSWFGKKTFGMIAYYLGYVIFGFRPLIMTIFLLLNYTFSYKSTITSYSLVSTYCSNEFVCDLVLEETTNEGKYLGKKASKKSLFKDTNHPKKVYFSDDIGIFGYPTYKLIKAE